MGEISRFHRNTYVTLYATNTQLNDFSEEVRILTPLNDTIKAYVQPSKRDQEIRRADQTIVLNPVDISCDGYYPVLTITHVMRINSFFYGLITIRHDDTSTYTVCIAEQLHNVRFNETLEAFTY